MFEGSSSHVPGLSPLATRSLWKGRSKLEILFDLWSHLHTRILNLTSTPVRLRSCKDPLSGSIDTRQGQRKPKMRQLKHSPCWSRVAFPSFRSIVVTQPPEEDVLTGHDECGGGRRFKQSRASHVTRVRDDDLRKPDVLGNHPTLGRREKRKKKERKGKNSAQRVMGTTRDRGIGVF